MKQIKSFKDLVINQGILILFKNKSNEEFNWLGQYKSESDDYNYYFDLINCQSGRKFKKFSLDISYTKNRWKIFKLTKKEFEKYKLKILINKL